MASRIRVVTLAACARQRRHPHRAVQARGLQEVLGHPERVEPQCLGLARELLHARRLVEAEIPPGECGQVDAESHRAAAGREPRYCVRPRIDAGWPGSFSFFPVSVIFVPSTRRIDTSRSVKLPT